tara:strand:- start:5065 stop:7416 length:2352 start_codon:yes stop_codon:yes gene_type:complete
MPAGVEPGGHFLTGDNKLNFVEYIAALAPEGETALIVRQKPQLTEEGELQFHADGALKATWPAQLPTKPLKKGGSYYGNTASFIIDRFENGRVSASASKCEYVLVMVLDDVGDPAKAPLTPPVPPTWIMETSEGSFQWGYAFSEQPTKGEFSAAIRAIATAGYSDPGATNPVRNFRIPGSVNLKPGKNSFESRLVEFHPEREFTLPELCAAFNVTPDDAADPFRPIRISDDGTDDVLAWLSEQGLVLRRPNLEGWAGIVCPNSAEHTDGNPEGRYLPSTRAFVCYHSHCIDFDSKAFLQWVEGQGGPSHDTGLRDELLAMKMAGVFDKIKPTEAFPDEAARVVAEVERKELGRIEKAQWYTRFAYIQDDESYFDMRDRREISRSTFNALFRHIKCNSIHNGRKIEASVCFDEHRQDMGAKTLVGITYAAGEDVLVARDGDVYGNRWRDARPPIGAAGDISRWLRHAEALVPDRAEREHLFDVMAFKVQHPEVKINHAVLHGGTQGCGKDTLWAPFIWAVCGPQLKNRGLLDNDTLGSQWGYQLESEILILNELKEPEAKDRRALANKLKPIIAAPPEMLSINRKGLHPYDMLNRMFVLAFSNDPVPISLDSQDRRWFCVWSTAPRMDPDAAETLWRWYKAGGYEAVAHWLHHRDVSAFNPAGAPAMTEFKMNLIEQGMSIAESYLVELMRLRMGEFSKGVVGSPFHALCDRVASGAPAGVKVPQAALLHALTEAGWVNLGRVASADYPSKKNLWAHPSVAGQSKSDLRRMVEETPSPLMVRVK